MEMTQADKLEIIEIAARFTEAQETATASVNEYTRLAVDPDDIGRGRAAVIGDGSARPQYLQGHAFGRRA